MGNGFIEPGLVPSPGRQTALFQEIVRKGLCLQRHGRAYVLRGLGVHVVVADLASLGPSDLKPQARVETLTRG